VWQYSHHVLAGLRSHQGPILTVANWSGQWPGLVGLLNLNGSLTKMGVKYSSIWSEDFKDEFFVNGIHQWIKTGKITHDTSHVQDLKKNKLPKAERALGEALAAQLKQDKAIIGIFDEGCMGMYNAVFDDELMNPAGIYKERLSQSALVAGMKLVKDAEAKKVRQWLDQRGVKFVTGKDEATELTDKQILEQCKMYIAAVRIAHDFGCAAIGIQYQQGLKDMVPASDLLKGCSITWSVHPFIMLRQVRNSTLDKRCRTSMKSMKVLRWMRLSLTASGTQWVSTLPPRSTIYAMANTSRAKG